MPKVYNKYHKDAPPDAIYVGRPSKWGNPFEIGKPDPIDSNHLMKREDVVRKYREMIEDLGPIAIRDIQTELKGKDLLCWCAPKLCHANILLEIANQE